MDGFLLVVCTLIVWFLYHKLFNVMYFDLGRGCLMEIMGCVVGGFILMMVIREFWYVAVIIAVLVVLYLFRKGSGK